MTEVTVNATQDSKQSSTRIPYSDPCRWKRTLQELLVCLVLVLLSVVGVQTLRGSLPAKVGARFQPSSLKEENCGTSNQAQLRGLQENENNTIEQVERPWVYSEYATIVPDPQHHQDDDEAKQQALAEEWGHWSFWDGEENIRPVGDQYAKYAYRDVPPDDFDDNAWTVDAVFVNHILDAGTRRFTCVIIFLLFRHDLFSYILL